MNMHVPQSIASAMELRYLATVLRQIISPRTNSAIIQLFQDTMTGTFRISNPNVQIPEHIAMNILARMNRPLSSYKRQNKTITGQELISMAFPLMNISDKIKVENGKLVKGILDKSAAGSIIQTLFNDFNPKRAGQFINDVQAIVTKYNLFSGFSVGASDLIPDPTTQEIIQSEFEKTRREVSDILSSVHAGTFLNNSGRSDGEELENQITNKTKDLFNTLSKNVTESLPKTNRVVQMVESGAKGSGLNITQMMGLLGQQLVEGRRIKNTLQDRTLPHFPRFDDGFESRGFVENSFITGLRPAEFFFHAMGGREGLIDTAIKSVVGETEIVIIENGNSKFVQIGDWIDSILNNSKTIEQDRECMKIENTYIPTTDSNGTVTWGEVTAVTRHNPTDIMYDIKTKGGRSVTVTACHSLLVWNESQGEFVPRDSHLVQVGDYVPVSHTLPDPPIITTSIQLDMYLPKTEFVYGTDFNTAVSMMNENMEHRKHIETGWWNQNNGTSFTLPYDSKARLQRATIQSESVENEFVYPWNSRRTHGIPEKLELNNINGIFIGLFLAEGHSSISEGTVAITNNNESVRAFVKEWFENMNINWAENTKINHIGGTTTTVFGYSTVLAGLLQHICGTKSENKHVPNECFTASTDCIKGILNGYFSGDGCITENSIESCSASSKLTDGISMLCTRIGVFGKTHVTQLKSNNLGTKHILPSYRFAIRAQWGSKFASQVTLIDDSKNKKLIELKCTETHRNFPTRNDVVLDEIISITQTHINEKVYDLTVPSTVNFGLANGLHVVDTSDSGYIQRKLVKSMEDLHMEYDGTVRNVNGTIIQFHYGGDGIDTTAIEKQPCELGEMSMEAIYRDFACSSADFEGITKESVGPDVTDMVEQILQDRDVLVRNVFQFIKNSSVEAPVHLKRLVEKYRNTYATKTDLMPDYVVSELNKLTNEPLMKHNKVFHILLRFYLAPKKSIINLRLSKDMFDELLRDIRFRYIKAQVQAGEMIGTLAAQSIGEPTTQLTLNSVDGTEEIIIAFQDDIKLVKIGEFIESQMKERSSEVQYIGNHQRYLTMPDGWSSISCDENGTIMWTKLEAVTDHPVVNEDGTSTILKVELESGRVITGTKGKSFLTNENGKIVGINGSELKIGMELPVSKSFEIPNTIQTLNLRTILSPTEWLYGTDVLKALNIMNSENVQGNKYWWKQHANVNFTIPYKRSDSFRDAFKNMHNRFNAHFKEGFVYNKNNCCEPTQIPETWELDSELGFFIGSYLAEGMSNKTQVMISNKNDIYIQRIRNLMDKWNVGTHVVRTTKYIEKTNIRGDGQDLIIHSVLLANVMKKLFGRTSYEKTFPEWILQSPDEFSKGLIDGYISGDGCITLKNTLTFSSSSEQLITRMNILLARFGIFTVVSSRMPELKNFNSVHKHYTSYVNEHFTYIFANTFKLTIPQKQERLLNCIKIGDHKTKRGELNQIVFDRIKSIREIEPTTGRVYDLTVETTRNFMLSNLVCQKDTFHSSGTVKANATAGVPRIVELLSATHNPKNPTNAVYLDSSISGSQDAAISKMKDIQKTTLRDITKAVRIYYDPNPLSSDTVVQEDRDILLSYERFSVTQGNLCVSPWILRLELDTNEMAARNVLDMTMIQMKIENNKVLRVFECVHSDTNTPNKMIMRITFAPEVVKNALSLRFIEEKLLDTVLVGVDGIGKAYVREVKNEMLYDEKIGGYTSVKQYVLDVDGTNLLDLALVPNTDPYRSLSNDVHEILDVFGIEAVRVALYREFMEAFSSEKINYHHLITLIDNMTSAGFIISVNRSGMSKNDSGVLTRSSFEETSKVLFNAAITADFDNMRGVSANIMFGQKPPCGTGFVDILIDETKLPEGTEEDLSTFDTDLNAANQHIEQEEIKESAQGECRMEDIVMAW